ncbi:PilN domain-containing protein [Photobacterium leiognathi]|uniref:Fimbrial assembly family protein n=2 Tax=Photobacterium leiognathi TaxID=553611 RepID=A0A0U1P8S7_PHOLE|nr:PilN domain-containing protein [Photobacterium leiognathi]KJF90837.1 pilus assembly protein PilS [Photobacterium leiognathi]PSU99377.1 pilus assembly protein PilS [Photobacterium leiognathi subsp. mandapamensis]PSV83096.1 pilus assembly protein PilS [Photobacterium leiognathi]PSW43510.1 pilus assembly protein PilS [Photobacterium leiognathi subsp. mandapamensis]PSW52573.1 pilus assembly protein PilS [Photobacterium leiognathi subsp. mandapamensis]
MIDKLNLLPWREERRKQHKQRFMGLIAAAVFVAFIGNYGVAKYLDLQQQQQQARNAQFQKEIDLLEKRLAFLPKLEEQRKAIQLRLNVIADIQQSRNRVTQLLNQLPNVVPGGVYLETLNLNVERVGIKGVGDSNGHLAALLGAAEQSKWFINVDMHSLVTTKGSQSEQLSQFNASFDLTDPSLAQQAKKVAKTNGSKGE